MSQLELVLLAMRNEGLVLPCTRSHAKWIILGDLVLSTGNTSRSTALFGWLHFWLMLMLILICCERKILFHNLLILADKLKRTEPKWLHTFILWEIDLSN